MYEIDRYEKGNIWLKRRGDTKFLQMTGWKDNPRKRKGGLYKRAARLTPVSYKETAEEVNKYWNSYVDIWTYEGEQYNNQGTEPTILDKLDGYEVVLVWHQGKLYWILNRYLKGRDQLDLYSLREKKLAKRTNFKNIKYVRKL